ncbi:MAG: DUF881 domain-containing protein [Clostridia bacterium]|nr:DUF881 domain-containing protein [Clostridia bacterium]
MKIHTNIAIMIVCIVLGVILAWQYKSIDYNVKAASLQNKRVDELKDELIREKKNNEDLAKRNADIEKRNREFEDARGKISETTKLLNEELGRARTIAGMTDVKGKGVIINLNHSDLTYIEDINILELINELRASDAQAISVNNERIVATSEVRTAGRFIMINGKQLLPPFEIKAIADPEKVEHTLKMIGGIIEKLEAYQLQVEVKASDNIVIPKVRDDGTVLKTDLLTPVKD